MAKANPKSLFSMILKDGKDDYRLDKIDAILGPIGNGIDAIGKFVNAADMSENEEYAQMIADDEVEVIEGLLGVAFVVCQTQIERVVHSVGLLHRHAESFTTPLPLTTTKTGKSSVMAFDSVRVGTSTVTRIEAMNAVANYFKHRDSWPGDWRKARGQAASTIDTIQKIGLEQGSSGNLRTASEALGNPSGYIKVSRFADAIRDWQSTLFGAYEAELRQANVL